MRLLSFMLGGLDGRQVTFVDSAAVDEESLTCNGVGHRAVVDVLVPDVGNLACVCRKAWGSGRGQEIRVLSRLSLCVVTCIHFFHLS